MTSAASGLVSTFVILTVAPGIDARGVLDGAVDIAARLLSPGRQRRQGEHQEEAHKPVRMSPPSSPRTTPPEAIREGAPAARTAVRILSVAEWW